MRNFPFAFVKIHDKLQPFFQPVSTSMIVLIFYAHIQPLAILFIF